MSRPIVIFKLNEDAVNLDDGSWGVSVDGKNPRDEYFVECLNKKKATILKNSLVNFLKTKKELYKTLRKTIFIGLYTDLKDPIWQLTEEH